MQALTHLKINGFVPSDLPELKDIYRRVRRETFGWMQLESLVGDTFTEDTREEAILVARLDGRVCGFVSIWMPDNFIHHIYVDTPFQRKGIGTALLGAAMCKLQGAATLKCLESNRNAIEFYGKNGWKVKSTGLSYEGRYVLFESAAC